MTLIMTKSRGTVLLQGRSPGRPALNFFKLSLYAMSRDSSNLARKSNHNNPPPPATNAAASVHTPRKHIAVGSTGHVDLVVSCGIVGGEVTCILAGGPLEQRLLCGYKGFVVVFLKNDRACASGDIMFTKLLRALESTMRNMH
jgi:hypothetical protein